MSDIVEWLRSTTGLGMTHPHLAGYTDRHNEAADLIERQRRLIESLKRTLIIVANVGSGEAKRIALADLRALDGGEDE